MEEVVPKKRGEAAGAEIGDDGREARAHAEVAAAAEELACESAEAGPRVEGAVGGGVQLHRPTGERESCRAEHTKLKRRREPARGPEMCSVVLPLGPRLETSYLLGSSKSHPDQARLYPKPKLAWFCLLICVIY